MDALVDQFAAAGELRVGAPFAVVADAPAVAVARADEHQRAERAGVDEFARLLQRRMEAVIVADPDERPVICVGGAGGRSISADGNGGGFFDEDVLAARDGVQRRSRRANR